MTVNRIDISYILDSRNWDTDASWRLSSETPVLIQVISSVLTWISGLEPPAAKPPKPVAVVSSIPVRIRRISVDVMEPTRTLSKRVIWCGIKICYHWRVFTCVGCWQVLRLRSNWVPSDVVQGLSVSSNINLRGTCFTIDGAASGVTKWRPAFYFSTGFIQKKTL
jgi:hypothetical protein